MKTEFIDTTFQKEIQKTKRYARLSEEVRIAREYFNSVRDESEMLEMYEYDNFGNGRLIYPSTMEDKINFIKRFSNNTTAMAYLNMINAEDLLSEYATTAYNTHINSLI